MARISKVYAYYQCNYFSKPYVGHHFGAGVEIASDGEEELKDFVQLQKICFDEAKKAATKQMTEHQEAMIKAGGDF